ncbi:MAG: hypothetical protein ACRDQZ_00955 [Mycobacteriales bacterium]
MESLTGQWQMEIHWSPKTHELAGGPAIVHGATSFEWIEGGCFLVQHQGADGAPHARWLFGRDDTSGEYRVLYADSRGVSRVYEMSFAESVWRIWRNAPGFHQRFEGRLAANGRAIHGRWEKSADGLAWEHDFDLDYARVVKR